MFSIRSYKQVFDLKQDYFSSQRLRAATNIALAGNTNEVVIPLNIMIQIRKKLIKELKKLVHRSVLSTDLDRNCSCMTDFSSGLNQNETYFIFPSVHAWKDQSVCCH